MSTATDSTTNELSATMVFYELRFPAMLPCYKLIIIFSLPDLELGWHVRPASACPAAAREFRAAWRQLPPLLLEHVPRSTCPDSLAIPEDSPLPFAVLQDNGLPHAATEAHRGQRHPGAATSEVAKGVQGRWNPAYRVPGTLPVHRKASPSA